jgi:signal transduction histidine kinase
MKHHSLFTKFTLLLFTATITGILFTHIIMAVHLMYMRKHVPVNEGIHLLTRTVASQIDITKEDSARALLKVNGLEMRYVNGSTEWVSARDVPTLATVREKCSGKTSFWFRGGLISVVTIGESTYIFKINGPFRQFGFPWGVVLIWSGFMVILFAFVHLVLRRTMHPIRILHKGVLQAGRGDFAIELPRTTNDELGDLIEAFNTMARKVRMDIASRDQLLHDISHELRSPLSRMMMALEFVPEGNIKQILKNNILTLDKMTVSILEEERIDSPYGNIKRELVELHSLVTEMIDHRNKQYQQVVLLDNEPCELPADRERLRMAIANIIDNGIKYSEKSGKPVEVRYRKEASTVVITIADYGIGIPEKDLPFIFEPFYRVDKARTQSTGGYGLGLSLVKKIIDAHGGTITVTSTMNTGSTFTITLPA